MCGPGGCGCFRGSGGDGGSKCGALDWAGLVSSGSIPVWSNTPSPDNTSSTSGVEPARLCPLKVIKRFALAGVSLGAATAMAYAARNQALISHLVLISPWVSGARLFDIRDLRGATSTPVTGEREWKVFANMLGSVATAFEDPAQQPEGPWDSV